MVVFWPIPLDKSARVSVLPANVSLVRMTYDYALDEAFGIFQTPNGSYVLWCFNAVNVTLPPYLPILPVRHCSTRSLTAAFSIIMTRF
jgi:hypothetical protein